MVKGWQRWLKNYIEISILRNCNLRSTCSNEDAVKMANDWSIVGKDLITEVTCKEPYEWKDITDEEWEFSKTAQANSKDKPFHVCSASLLS